MFFDTDFLCDLSLCLAGPLSGRSQCHVHCPSLSGLTHHICCVRVLQ
nr:MAG TPA: venom polypeptide-like protein [Caudoviricetes sp.]